MSGDDREFVYNYIISRFGQDKTGFIVTFGTASDKRAIEEICRAFSNRWIKSNLIDTSELKAKIKAAAGDKDLKASLNEEMRLILAANEEKEKENPYSISKVSKIKEEFDKDPEGTKKKYSEIFYYYDGVLNTKLSQSTHPAGIVASPITLADNYGTFLDKEGRIVMQIDMEAIHDVSLVKYDILGLRNVKIIKDCYKLLGKPYPKAHEIDWNDQAVWKDMLKHRVGVFQFEGKQNCPH